MTLPYPEDGQIPEGATVIRPYRLDTVESGIDVDFRPKLVHLEDLPKVPSSVPETVSETHPSATPVSSVTPVQSPPPSPSPESQPTPGDWFDSPEGDDTALLDKASALSQRPSDS